MGASFDAALDTGLRQLAVTLTGGTRAAIEAHARLLVGWTGSVNLTAHRDPEAIAIEHVLDSLSAAAVLRGTGSLIDLGSGAGYPGLPLAVCLPVMRCALVDSVAKKARFLTAAASAATVEMAAHREPVPEIMAIGRRIEDVAHDPAQRESWEAVTARAVASMRELAELGLPLLDIGGLLVAWKRDDGMGGLDAELASARAAISHCGGTDPEVRPVTLSGLEDHRLVVIAKRRHSPREVPRPAAVRRRPLLG